MNNCKANPDWEQLPKPDVGDIVELKLSDVFNYVVKAVVKSVDENKITATIDALFDWQSGGELRPWDSGNKWKLVGNEISFSPRLIWNVIKKQIT